MIWKWRQPESRVFLNYMTFDKNYVPVTDVSQTNYVRISTAAKETGTDIAHQKLTATVTVKQAGYMYIYFSNEESTTNYEAFFDDFTVTHSKSPVLQAEDYYPFGLVATGYRRENIAGQSFKYNGKELQDELNLGWLDYGARMYMPEIGRWGVVDPMAEKYYPLSPYDYVGSNPIIRVDPDGMDWLLSTGDKIYWYAGDTGDKSELRYTYKATSGLSSEKASDGKNHQVASEQNNKDVGPTPEGTYYINLVPDPDRKATIGSNGLVKSNPEGGIENLEGMQMDGDSENRYVSPEWGKNRAHLEPVKVTGATSKERDNNSYYLHDSQKGYTHGCTEVDGKLFDQLKDFRSQGNTKIDVIIDYPAANHKTNGGTKKEK